MNFYANMSCCGLIEIENVSGLEDGYNPNTDIKAELLRGYFDNPLCDSPRNRAFAIFTGVVDENGRCSYGGKLATFLKKNRLGRVWTLGTRMNPNSGNMLRMWVWAIDHKAMNRLKKEK